jgi:hypothetical protein
MVSCGVKLLANALLLLTFSGLVLAEKDDVIESSGEKPIPREMGELSGLESRAE